MSGEVLILALYSVGIVGIGLWASRGVKTSGDFLVAGRNLGLWVLVGTLTMTELNTMSHVGSGKGVGFGIDAASLFEIVNRELFQAATQTRQKATIPMYLLKAFANFI